MNFINVFVLSHGKVVRPLPPLLAQAYTNLVRTTRPDCVRLEFTLAPTHVADALRSLPEGVYHRYPRG